jgi:hypothetical protein
MFFCKKEEGTVETTISTAKQSQFGPCDIGGQHLFY